MQNKKRAQKFSVLEWYQGINSRTVKYDESCKLRQARRNVGAVDLSRGNACYSLNKYIIYLLGKICQAFENKFFKKQNARQRRALFAAFLFDFMLRYRGKIILQLALRLFAHS